MGLGQVGVNENVGRTVRFASSSSSETSMLNGRVEKR